MWEGDFGILLKTLSEHQNSRALKCVNSTNELKKNEEQNWFVASKRWVGGIDKSKNPLCSPFTFLLLLPCAITCWNQLSQWCDQRHGAIIKCGNFIAKHIWQPGAQPASYMRSNTITNKHNINKNLKSFLVSRKNCFKLIKWQTKVEMTKQN